MMTSTKISASLRGFAVFWRVVRFVCWALFTSLIILWCIENRTLVQVSFMPLAYALELPLFVLVLVCVTLAYALATFQAWVVQLHLRKRIKHLQSRLQAMENVQHQQQLAERLKNETRRDAEDAPMADAEPWDALPSA